MYQPKYPHVSIDIPIKGVSPDILREKVEKALRNAGVGEDEIVVFHQQMSETAHDTSDITSALAIVEKWMMINRIPLTKPRIILEFIGGGDWDGKTLDSHSENCVEARMAQEYYEFSKQGEVGCSFHGVSMGKVEEIWRGGKMSTPMMQPKMSHKYTVVERIAEGNEVLVRIQYSVSDQRDLQG